MSNNPMHEEIPCESVDEFIAALRPSNRRWSDGLESDWVFRGHAEQVLKVLWRESITLAHLMPTLDNVRKALKQRWGWKDDLSG